MTGKAASSPCRAGEGGRARGGRPDAVPRSFAWRNGAAPRAFLTEEAAGALPTHRRDAGIAGYRHKSREQAGSLSKTSWKQSCEDLVIFTKGQKKVVRIPQTYFSKATSTKQAASPRLGLAFANVTQGTTFKTSFLKIALAHRAGSSRRSRLPGDIPWAWLFFWQSAVCFLKLTFGSQ